MADATYTVTRDISIAASPEQVYPELVDFHRWQAWSPWEDLDPDQKRIYGGAATGLGARYAWSGNRKVGQGRMEIIEANPPGRVQLDLRFIKPFKSSSTTTFDLQPEGDQTRVTWTMTGPKTLMTRIMGIVRSMDAMVGPDFEKGLARLKAVVES